MKLFSLFGLWTFVAGHGQTEMSSTDLHKVTTVVTFNMTVTIDGHVDRPIGVIEIGLFGKAVPITARNFCKLAKGYRFPGKKDDEGFEG